MTRTLIERSEAVLMQLYPAQPVVPERGKGCFLYDADGKAYLDCAAGIAVCALGHAHPGYVRALAAQAEKFVMCPASYVTEPKVECAEALVRHSGLDRVFFCNSGAEAVEAALKLAMLWGYETKGEACRNIIAFEHGFHGRTQGAAGVTQKIRQDKRVAHAMMPHVRFARYNDAESVAALVDENTCAILVEPVQGEGGIVPATPAFLKALRIFADTHGAALIVDEIQTGMGRTGTLFAFEHYGVEPDILCLAKGLGGGFPIGAMLAREEFARHFRGGVHGSTYGGNPLATAAARFVLGEIVRPGFLEAVRATGALLRDGLEKLQKDTGAIEEVRGMGLMVGVDTVLPCETLLPALLKEGMIATRAGQKTLRLTPPLIAGPEEVALCLETLGTVLKRREAL